MESDSYKLFCEQLEIAQLSYPNLRIIEVGNHKSLKGILDIPNDKNEIIWNFLIEIKYKEGFPRLFPKLLEIGGDIPNEADFHKYLSGECCVTIAPDEILKCAHGMDVLTFIKMYAIPYFANQVYKKYTGYYKNGEYYHGVAGYIQFYEELFMTPDVNLWHHHIKYFLNKNRVIQSRQNYSFGNILILNDKYLKWFNLLQLIGIENVLKDLKSIIK